MDQVRGRADEWMRELAREGRGSTPGVGHLIVEVIDGGSKPTSAPGRFLARVLTVTGGEAENAVAGFTALDDREVVVTVLGGVPAVGERLVASHSAGRWFARRKGTSPPVGDRILCGTARGCGGTGAGLVGATFRVTGPGGFDQSCATAANGQCCVTGPGDGAYTAEMSHPDHGSRSQSVVITKPGYVYLTYCLGSPGAGLGGHLCVEVADCGQPAGTVGRTVEFVQRGVVVATAVVQPTMFACACLPEKVATTIRMTDVPPRYLPAELFVPAALVPGQCGKASLFNASGCGPPGGPPCRLIARPAPGYGCWVCLDVGCDIPVADVLHLTDPATGRPVTMTRSGIEWRGEDVAPTEACGSYSRLPVCPPASVPLRYRLGPGLPSGAVNPDPRCFLSVSAPWHYERFQYGPKPDDVMFVLCPGPGSDPASQEILPGQWRGGSVRVNVLTCPPGFTAVSEPMVHPLLCDGQFPFPTVTFPITE